jgi:hypothetical protein
MRRLSLIPARSAPVLFLALALGFGCEKDGRGAPCTITRDCLKGLVCDSVKSTCLFPNEATPPRLDAAVIDNTPPTPPRDAPPPVDAAPREAAVDVAADSAEEDAGEDAAPDSGEDAGDGVRRDGARDAAAERRDVRPG